MSGPAGGAGSPSTEEHVGWELVDPATGRVRSGRRTVGPRDVEVLAPPPPPAPRLRGLVREPGRTLGEAAGWLLTGGRGITTKRFRLVDDLWLVLRELRSPREPTSVVLAAESPALAGTAVLAVDDVTATEREGTGSLRLTWGRDGDGFPELLGALVLTDVTVALRAPGGPRDRPPARVLRVLAGSSLRWPADGRGTAPGAPAAAGPPVRGPAARSVSPGAGRMTG